MKFALYRKISEVFISSSPSHFLSFSDVGNQNASTQQIKICWSSQLCHTVLCHHLRRPPLYKQAEQQLKKRKPPLFAQKIYCLKPSYVHSDMETLLSLWCCENDDIVTSLIFNFFRFKILAHCCPAAVPSILLNLIWNLRKKKKDAKFLHCFSAAFLLHAPSFY